MFGHRTDRIVLDSSGDPDPRRVARGWAANFAVGAWAAARDITTEALESRLAELLRSCGLSPSDQRTLGEGTPSRRAWGGFAIATVNSEAGGRQKDGKR